MCALPANCLSLFDHFVELVLKELGNNLRADKIYLNGTEITRLFDQIDFGIHITSYCMKSGQ